VTIEDFIEKFTFAIEAEQGMLTPETRFKELSIWDSLNALSVIAMADADFNASLSGQQIEQSSTIGELWSIVQSQAAK
jgi:acyl carrier protein